MIERDEISVIDMMRMKVGKGYYRKLDGSQFASLQENDSAIWEQWICDIMAILSYDMKRLGFSHDEQLDIVQGCLLHFQENGMMSFRGNSFTGWLRIIGRNAAIDQVRRNSRQKTISIEKDPETNRESEFDDRRSEREIYLSTLAYPTLEEQVLDRIEAHEIVGKLSPVERIVAQARADGYTFSEIAMALNIHPVTVKVKMRRATKKVLELTGREKNHKHYV